MRFMGHRGTFGNIPLTSVNEMRATFSITPLFDIPVLFCLFLYSTLSNIFKLTLQQFLVCVPLTACQQCDDMFCA